MIEIPLLWLLPIIILASSLIAKIILKYVHYWIVKIFIMMGCIINILILSPTVIYLIIYPVDISFTSAISLYGSSLLLSINQKTTIMSISIALGIFLITLFAKRRFFSKNALAVFSALGLAQLLVLIDNALIAVIMFNVVSLMPHYIALTLKYDDEFPEQHAHVFFWNRVADCLITLGIVMAYAYNVNAASSFCFLIGIVLRTSFLVSFNAHMHVLNKVFYEFRVFYFYCNFILPLIVLIKFAEYGIINNHFFMFFSALNCISLIYAFMSLLSAQSTFQGIHSVLFGLFSLVLQYSLLNHHLLACGVLGLLFIGMPIIYKVIDPPTNQEVLKRESFLAMICRGYYAPFHNIERMMLYMVSSIAQLCELVLWPFVLKGALLRIPALAFGLVRFITKIEHSSNVKRTFVIVILVTCACALWYG